MPTYEYKCSACGHAFEKFQSIKAAPITKCPECKKNKVKRLIGMGAGLIFKGSGFYITDYRSDGYKNAAKSDSAAPATTPASDSTAKVTPATSSGTAEKATKPAKSEAKPKSSK